MAPKPQGAFEVVRGEELCGRTDRSLCVEVTAVAGAAQRDRQRALDKEVEQFVVRRVIGAGTRVPQDLREGRELPQRRRDPRRVLQRLLQASRPGEQADHTGRQRVAGLRGLVTYDAEIRQDGQPGGD